MAVLGAKWKHSSTKLHPLFWLLAVCACEFRTIVCLTRPFQLELYDDKSNELNRFGVKGIIIKSVTEPERIFFNQIKQRIINGHSTESGEYPHMARIRIGRNIGRECGGAILNSRYILTAGHCLIDSDSATQWTVDNMEVVVGDYNREDLNGEQVFKVKRVVRHPNLQYLGQDVWENDIGLVETAQPISMLISPFGPGSVAKICEIVSKPKDLVVVTAWGKDRPGGDFQTKLTRLIVPIVDFKLCNEKYYSIKRLNLPKGTLCAGYTDISSTGICKGCGSPLIEHPLEHECPNLVGILSGGEVCNEAMLPGLYTNVSYYLDWINKEIST